MLVSHHREKLINAVLFFAASTKYCGKIKVIKLLYLLDFEHYRQTGRSVTGLEYHAWKMGPVPIDFYQEWDDLAPDLAQAITVEPVKVYDFVCEEVRPLQSFDDSHFTKRELQIMQALATRCREDMSRPMVNVSHRESGPWDAIWDEGRGNGQRIPYQLAIDATGAEREELLHAAREYEGIAAAARSSE
ncbi:MAG: SocA family protein [Burkholderiales bacterium]|nr:SocA family protein [Burkholderiales bacterium]